MARNAIYAQSGGVTAVINASACAVIQSAQQYPDKIAKVYAAKNGIIGALREELIDTSLESQEAIAALMHTPSGAFGSCRYKLQENSEDFEQLLKVFMAHDIGYFYYNGGGDSQDTAYKIAQLAKDKNYPLSCIGIPKTVDNDLPFTDNCPGFGSVAKYVAISTLEAGFDVASMAESSTKVFVLEVMGRHAGWIAAASGLANPNNALPPHLILFPEITFDAEAMLRRVKQCVDACGYCVIVASEGLRDASGTFISEAGVKDAFGHSQLGGVAPMIAKLIKDAHGYKYHWAVADYLQRAARHIASKTDVEQAYALGKAAVELSIEGHNAVMPYIERVSDSPYQWIIKHAPLSEIANVEKTMPRHYISEDGFGISPACRAYLAPLIVGEAYPPYASGLPKYIRLNNRLVPKKL